MKVRLDFDFEIDYFIFSLMVFVVFVLASFATLTVSIDSQFLRIKFGY